MKTFLFTFFILTTAAYSAAQKTVLDDTKTVIASAGSSFQNDDISLSWTIGNTLFYIGEEGNREISLDLFDLAYAFTAFPNPTSDHLVISYPAQYENMDVVIYDLYGRKYLHEKMPYKRAVLELVDLPPSLYFVKIFNADDQLVKTFKIIKN